MSLATDLAPRIQTLPAATLPTKKQLFDRVNKVVAPLARSGLASPLPVGPGLVMLRTAGRVTGRRQEVPLLSVRVGHLVLVGTVRPTSHWFKNLAVDPAPEVWLKGKVRPAEATVRTGPFNLAVLDLLPGGVRPN
ncbi:MAG: nitroreductase/quinone reductase family protein [Actinomycetes bacterium]